MKRLLLAAAALSVSLTGTLASAQDRGEYGREHHGDADRRDGRDDRRDYRGRDDGRGYRDRDGGRDYRGRGDDRSSHARYARGQRFRGDGAYLSDYGRYGYRAPPRGYRYYRTNQGDVVLAAIATGIIASVIATNGR